MSTQPTAHGNAEIDRLFAEALELSTAEQFNYLAQLRLRDAGLADVVQNLLAAASAPDPRLEAGRWLRGPIWDDLTRASLLGPNREGERVGAYRILQELDRGGMSVVYLAERADGAFDQRVALKFLAVGASHESGLRRFEQERRILAALNHPNIARLVDGGADQRGCPYLVMEYVQGRALDEFCKDSKSDLERRLELFDIVAAAVEYAHRHLVVHRDLKPSNILVTDDGQVKLLDFGIAKLLEPAGASEFTAPRTQTLVRVLTPEYASPEQMRGESVTTSSDIYQLGALLYELLAGCRPFSFERATLSQIERTICEDEPVRPSVAADQSQPHMTRRLASDLDNIVLKALEKQPDRRYRAVGELREDLKRFQQGQPVSARTLTVRYRAQKFVRRHRTGVVATALLLLLLSGYAATVTVQARRIAAEAARTERVKEFLTSLFTLASPIVTKGDEPSAAELVDAGARRVATELSDQPDIQAELMTTLGQVYVALGRYAEATGQLAPALQIRRSLASATREDVARTAQLLGVALHYEGRYAEAETRLREAAEIEARLFGAQDLRVAGTLKELGDLLHSRGELVEAEAILRRVLNIQIALAGEQSTAAAVTRRDLANVRRDRGGSDEAELLYRTALQVLHARLGTVDPVVARTRGELALLLAETGQHDEAEVLLQENAAVYAKLYPRGHAMEGTTFRNLGVLRLRQNRLVEAQDAFERALENYRRTLSERNALIPRVQRYLAEALLELGDADAAAALAGEAVTRLRNAGSPEHPAVADALETLGRARLAQERAAGAVEVLTASLALRNKSSIPADPRLAITRGHLARARAPSGTAHSTTVVPDI